MPILKRVNKYQGLKDISVFREESGLTSQFFNVYEFPETITQGASSFLIAGSPFLKPNIEIKVEILDSGGNTIYTEPIRDYLESGARRVSIEVYNDVMPGDGFMYIVGELKEDFQNIQAQLQNDDDVTGTVPITGLLTTDDDSQAIPSGDGAFSAPLIPEEFRGVYNVRYSRPVFINAASPNVQPIFFYQQPSATITEQVKGYVETTVVTGSIVITGSVAVDPAPDLPPPSPPPPDPPAGFPKDFDGELGNKVGQKFGMFKKKRKAKRNPLRNTGFSSRGRLVRRFSPELDEFEITFNEMESTIPKGGDTEAGKVSSEMVGANITINKPTVDPVKFPAEEFDIPDKFETTVKKVKDNKKFVPLDKFFVTRKDTGERVNANILLPTGTNSDGSPKSNFTMSFTPTPEEKISTTHFRSFADITVRNLRTFSGDVYKAKVMAKSQGTLGDFETLYESPIEAPQLLIDPYSRDGFLNTGFFYSQSIVDNYWITGSNTTATKNDDFILDGVYISGSNYPLVEKLMFQNSGSFDLENNVPYSIRFNLYYQKALKETAPGVSSKEFNMNVYVHNKALVGTGSISTEDWHLVGRIDEDDVVDDSGVIEGVYGTFLTPDAVGTDPQFRMKFEVEAGAAVIEDINVSPYSQTGFNPNFFRVIVPMPHPLPKKPDEYDFLIEFYDINNNIADTVVINEGEAFTGAPINIDGEDNLLSGSLFIGNAQGEGMELAGVSSAFLRSIGYNGFNRTISENKGGFLIFSGSIGSRLTASEAYDGVGLEIVDAHGATNRFLKFRTNPSTFQVVTDEFFLGSTTQFVSGSNGNIEISSSNFHLSSSGDVTMAGTISATAGNIGDFQIIGGQISGSNMTLNAPRSQLFKTDQGPGSDPQTFAPNRDEYYIDFTPSESNDPAGTEFYIKMGRNFMVDKSGILIASGAKFEGTISASAGLIGGFTTDSSSFHSKNIFISGSPVPGGIDDPKYMFISTSNFNIKENGDVTGSSFLLEGGTITEGVTILGSVTANQIRTPALINGSPSTAQNASSSIDQFGFASFKSASIAGWIINPTSITDPNTSARIKSDTSTIALGSTIPTNLSSNGIFLSGSGEFNFQKDASNLIRLNGSTFDIKSQNFTLAGGSTLLLNTTKLAFDTSNSSTAALGTGTGIFMNTSGEFRAGAASGNRITFDGSSTIAIVTDTFNLDTPKLDISTDGGGKIALGTVASLTTTGIFLSGSGHFNLQKDTDNFIRNVSSGFDIASTNFTLKGGDTLLLTNTKFALDTSDASAANKGTGTGVYMANDGRFRVGVGTGNRLTFDGSSAIEIVTDDLNIDTSTFDVSTDNGGVLKLGPSNIAEPSLSTNGLFLSGSGEFNFQRNADNFIRNTTAGFDITSEDFTLKGGTTLLINNTKIVLDNNDTSNASSANRTTGDGVFMNNSGEFRVGKASSNRITFDGSSTIEIVTDDLNIDTTTLDISTDNGGTIKLGTSPALDAAGIFLSGSGEFNFQQDASNFIRQSGGAFSIKASTFDLDATSLIMDSAGDSGNGVIRLGGSGGPSTPTANVQGIYMDGGGALNVYGNATNFFRIDGGSFTIASDTFDLDAGTIIMDSATNNGKMALGATPPTAYNSGNGFYVDGTGKLLIGSGSGDRIQFDGSNFTVQVGSLELDATNIEISSTNASMSLGEGNIILDGSNNKIKVGKTTSKQVEIVGSSTQGYIATGKSSATDTTAGFWLANNNTDPEFSVGNSTNFIKFDGGNVDIQSQKLELDAGDIQISSTEASMSLGTTFTMEGAGTPTFKLGPDIGFISISTGSGVFMDGGGNFRVGDDDGFLKFENGSFTIRGSDVDIDVTEVNITSNGFRLSSTEASMSLGTNDQLFMRANAASPFLSIGQSTKGFGNTGVFLGFVNSVSRPRVSFVGSAGHFKFDTGLDIQTDTFELDANTGDLQISSGQKSMSLADQTIVLDGPNSKITVGSANALTIQGGATDNFIVMGSKTTFGQTTTTGAIFGMDSSVPTFDLTKTATDYFRFDTTNGLDLSTTKLEASATNIQISSNQASMSIGPISSNPIVIQSLGDDRFIKFGGKSDYDQTTTAGFIMGMDNGVAKFDFTIGTGNDNYVRMGSSGVDIKTPSFILDTTNLDINSATSRIVVSDGSNERVRIGEISDSASDLYGMKIYDGSGTADSNTLVKLGQEGNEIAGWTITNSALTGGNMIIRQDGTIESAGFASDVAGSGFRLTAAQGGFLEVENAKIRGTLATAVFEKETVNAVGGQLYVANSTTLTSSIYNPNGIHLSSQNTMSVVNVSGFEVGEILSAKKVSSTGFSTEYLYVESSSRDDATSETNFSGQLFVTRSYGKNLLGDSGSLGNTPGGAQSYSGSQVIVSTGRYISGNAPNTVGSGYIRMNANPADPTTPYMDIVERTGSGIYDVELKARLGDLSGLSSGLLFGETNPGFGLFTENVFLQGAIVATTGSITGQLFVNTSGAERLILGIDIAGSNDGLHINNNNYWYTTGAFKVGSSNYYLQNDSSGNISLQPKTFELEVGTDLQISSTQKSMSFSNNDILLDAESWGGSVRIGRNIDRAVIISGSASAGIIRMGKNSVSDSTEGFWIANNNQDAEFSVGDGVDFIKFDDNALSLSTRTFALDAGSGDLQLSSTQHSMSFADGALKLGKASNGVSFVQVGSNSTNNIQITGSSTLGAVRSNKTTFSDNNSGFWLANNAGDTEFNLGSSTQFIKFDSGTGVLSIASDNLNFTASNVDITTGVLLVDSDDFQINSTVPSMSLGYDTNSNAGITINGGSPSTIKFGPKSSPKMTLQSDTQDAFLSIGTIAFGSETNAGILIGSDNGNAELRLYKDADEFFTYDATDGFDLRTTKFRVNTGGGFDISGTSGTGTSNFLKLGSATSETDGTGIYMDGGGNFRVGTATSGNSYLYFDPDTSLLEVKSDIFNLDTTTLDIVALGANKANRISLGASPPTNFTSNGIIMSGSGFFNFQKDAYNFIRHDSNGLKLASQELNISGSTTFRLHGNSSGAQIRLGASADSITTTTNTGIYMDQAGNFRVGEATSGDNFIYFNGSSVQIKSTNFDLTAGSAGSGQLGISTTRIALGSTLPTAYDSGTGFFVDNDGNFLLGTHNGNRIQFGGSGDIQIVSSDIDITSTAFSLSSTNILLNTSTFYLGTITANNDSTGAGFYADTSGNVRIFGDSNNFITFGSNTLSIRTNTFDFQGTDFALNNTRIYLGTITTDSDSTGAGFYADSSGNVRAFSDADNFVTVGSGGVSVSAETFDLNAGSGKLVIESSTPSMTLSTADAKIKLGSATAIATGDGVFMDGTGDFRAGGASSNFIKLDSNVLTVDTPKFTIDSGGNVTMAGNVSASSGQIAGFTIDGTRLKQGSSFYLDGDQSGDYFLFSSKFNVTPQGEVTASSMFLSGSEVTMRSDNVILKGPSFELNSVGGDDGKGFIQLGAATLDNTSKGFFANKDGDLVIRDDVGGEIRVSSPISIKTSVIDIDTDKFQVLTSGTMPTMSLGVTPPKDITGQGFFVDGDGKFLVGSGSGGNKISFDGSNLAIKANDIDITSTTFNLNANSGDLLIDSANRLISVANGNITIDGDSNSNVGHLEVGGLSSTATNQTAAGFYAKGDGEVLIKATTTANSDYLKFSSSGLDINTQQLEVDATKLYISSDNQRIAIGDDGSAVTYDSAGIFLGEDGSGVYKFSVKSATGDSLKFDGAGTLEITGNITADSGNIGGFIVGSTLSATNILLDPATPKITVGSKAALVDANSGFYAGTDGISLGENSPFKVTSAGALTATSALITGSSIEIHTDNFRVDSSGNVTGNDLTLSGTQVFKQSTTTVARIGTVNLQSGNSVGIDAGGYSPSNQSAGSVVARTDVPYEAIVIAGGQTHPDAHAGGQLIRMGIDYLNKQEGRIGYDFTRTGEAFEIYTYEDLQYSGLNSVATPADVNNTNTLSLQPSNSGSLVICKNNTGNFVNIFDDYSSAINNTLKYPFYVDDPGGHFDQGHVAYLDGNIRVAGDIEATGNVTAYVSDERLKNFHGKVNNAIEKIKQLNGYYFTLNETALDLGYKNNGMEIGVRAQEVEKVLPEVVGKAPVNDKGIIDGGDAHDYKTVKYDRIVPLLIEAVKEQQEQIEELKRELEEIKGG